MTDNMQAVLDRWTEDPSFREGMRTDLDGTLKGAGIELDDDTAGQLRAVDWSQSDAELEQLIEKYRMAC